MPVCKISVYEKDFHNLSSEAYRTDVVREASSNYIVQPLKSAHTPSKQTGFRAVQTGVSSRSPFVLREA